MAHVLSFTAYIDFDAMLIGLHGVPPGLHRVADDLGALNGSIPASLGQLLPKRSRSGVLVTNVQGGRTSVMDRRLH
ncbi:hypothetical protein [uncultured Tateyamaria sp.]|uniref:hypothetical protein n=1 Tax=uncultured Tateyamaria sp. TaxID=455651 RepID=UPI002625A4C7|nr:hypothetical protein [uncultured Tateyamaria sp.]